MSPTDRPKPPNVGPPPEGPDPDDPPSEEELRAADALRRVLQGSATDGERGGPQPMLVRDAARTAEWAQSLRAAASPREIAPERHRRLIDRALSPPRGDASRPVESPHPPKNKVVYLAFGSAAGLLAMAAAVALVIRSSAPDAAISAKSSAERGTALALSRSTVELFPEGIPRSGGTSHRVDRIAYARAQDFRQNRFARWGAP